MFDPQREVQLLARLRRENTGSLSDASLSAIYQAIFASARSVQKRFVIGYRGAQGSEAHLAALDIFGMDAEYVPLTSAAVANDALRKGECDYWVDAEDPGKGQQNVVSVDLPGFQGRRYFVVDGEPRAVTY